MLLRSIGKGSIPNAMTLDITMGGSTILFCTCWQSPEAELDLTMKDIDALSRKIPQLAGRPNTPTITLKTYIAPVALWGFSVNWISAGLPPRVTDHYTAKR